MDYIRKHWRGELSLSMSFWVNALLISIIIFMIDYWFINVLRITHPVVSVRLSLILTLIKLCLVCPWQIVGLWRASEKHVITHGRLFWARTVQVIVVVVCICSLVIVCASWSTYKYLYQIGFQEDISYPDYTLTLRNNDSLIHLEGGFRIGVSKEVAAILKKNLAIKGIILDTGGGRAFEAMALSKLILRYDLDTYSLKGCFSAGTIAFVSGSSRFLGTGAKLGFHKGHYKHENLFTAEDAKEVQESSLVFFQQKGIKREFLKKIYTASHKEIWIPSIEELIDAGVIHGVINPSDLSQYHQHSQWLD